MSEQSRRSKGQLNNCSYLAELLFFLWFCHCTGLLLFYLRPAKTSSCAKIQVFEMTKGGRASTRAEHWYPW